MTDHKQKTICFEDNEIKVDEKLAELISGLLKHGYTTALSCQDNDGGKVWLYFINDVSKDLMRDCLKFHIELFDYLSLNGDWEICYNEEARFINENELEGTGRLEYGHSLRFPKEDFETVEKMFKEFFDHLRSSK